MAVQYSVLATDKSGSKILFSIIQRIDLSVALGDLAQEFLTGMSWRLLDWLYNKFLDATDPLYRMGFR